MIIDFHTHVFPDKIASSTINSLESKGGNKAYTDGTVNGLLSHMKESGVDISVALPVLTKPSQFDSVVKFAQSVNERFSGCKTGRIISFAGIHPACEDIQAKMRLVKDLGFLGVKIHPDYQSTFIDDDGYVKILKCAKDLDLIVVTHSGVDDAYVDEPVKCPPELCLKVIKKVGHEKFVLGHYGAHKQWEETLDILCGQNVYFDTAFTLHDINSQLFKAILNKHGEDKVLFATDCPWRNMKEDIQFLRSFGLEKHTLDKILYINAKKLLGL